MCENSKVPKKVKIVVEDAPAGAAGVPCELHKPGMEYTFDFERCPENFCSSAFHALFPTLRVLEMGGRHPWDAQAGVTYGCCPDAGRPVTFRLEVYGEDE